MTQSDLNPSLAEKTAAALKAAAAKEGLSRTENAIVLKGEALAEFLTYYEAGDILPDVKQMIYAGNDANNQPFALAPEDIEEKRLYRRMQDRIDALNLNETYGYKDMTLTTKEQLDAIEANETLKKSFKLDLYSYYWEQKPNREYTHSFYRRLWDGNRPNIILHNEPLYGRVARTINSLVIPTPAQ